MRAPQNRDLLAWMELDLRLREGKTIVATERLRAQGEAKRWKLILSRIIDIVKFLAKQNQSFRGHLACISYNDEEEDELLESTNRGNFSKLAHLTRIS